MPPRIPSRVTCLMFLICALAIPVPARSQTRAPARRPAPVQPAAPPRVDLNNATLKELESLPGIGKLSAQRIIAGRPFRDIRQLRALPGMSDRKLYDLLPLVTLNPPRPVTAPAQSTTTTTKQAATANAAPAAKIELNTATIEQLDTLPGIGPAKARAIISARPFQTIEGIKNVKGIGDATYDKLKDRIYIR